MISALLAKPTRGPLLSRSSTRSVAAIVKPGFYRRLGYIEQATITDYPSGYSDIHFRKRLDDAGAVRHQIRRT